eukprot:COSAG05_NODE_117_length_17936_cov_137.220945_5_plen_86_part_00
MRPAATSCSQMSACSCISCIAAVAAQKLRRAAQELLLGQLVLCLLRILQPLEAHRVVRQDGVVRLTSRVAVADDLGDGQLLVICA